MKDVAWERALPKALKASGKPVVDIPGAETAWPVSAAPELIHWLQAHGYAVLGGDYYSKNGKAFEPAYETWHCELTAGESWSAYVTRSCTKALGSLKAANAQHWIVIVASSKPTAEQLAAINAR